MHGTDRDIATLERLRTEHVRGVNEQDVELVLRDYAEDLVYLSPGVDPIVGKDVLRAFISPLYESTRFEISMTPEVVEVSKDAAFEWGYVAGTTTPRGSGPSTEISTRYALVYRRRPDDSWEIRCASMNEGPSNPHS